jgi:hypothetical protein
MELTKQGLRSASLPVGLVGGSIDIKQKEKQERQMTRRDSAPSLPRPNRWLPDLSEAPLEQIKISKAEGEGESSAVRQTIDGELQKVVRRRHSMSWPTVPPVQRLGFVAENLDGIRRRRFNLEVSTDLLLDTLSISLVLPFGAVLAMPRRWAEVFLCALFVGLIWEM